MIRITKVIIDGRVISVEGNPALLVELLPKCDSVISEDVIKTPQPQMIPLEMGPFSKALNNWMKRQEEAAVTITSLLLKGMDRFPREDKDYDWDLHVPTQVK
tara:strand:- start:27683 stop:27988 length:306 start_codon:yes stop_codon:yes gene_type:complete